jgi:hypothetical protein
MIQTKGDLPLHGQLRPQSDGRGLAAPSGRRHVEALSAKANGTKGGRPRKRLSA